MTNASSDRGFSRRLWMTTLALVLAISAGGAPFLVAETTYASARATPPAVDVDFDESDAAAADALGLRVAQRIQEEIELAAFLAVCLPLLGVAVFGLVVA